MIQRTFQFVPGIQLVQYGRPGESSQIILKMGLGQKLIACTYGSDETAKLIFNFLVENPDSYMP
jgi:hypothetical protein